MNVYLTIQFYLVNIISYALDSQQMSDCDITAFSEFYVFFLQFFLYHINNFIKCELILELWETLCEFTVGGKTY